MPCFGQVGANARAESLSSVDIVLDRVAVDILFRRLLQGLQLACSGMIQFSCLFECLDELFLAKLSLQVRAGAKIGHVVRGGYELPQLFGHVLAAKPLTLEGPPYHQLLLLLYQKLVNLFPLLGILLLQRLDTLLEILDFLRPAHGRL